MSAQIIRFPGHKWAHCEKRHCTGCHLCHGGLAVCSVCGGFEGALTTDCPGYRVSLDTGDDVYEGIVDYRRDLGWVLAPSKYSPGPSL